VNAGETKTFAYPFRKEKIIGALDWALAGSIIAILGVFPLGVAATIFVAMAKDEFEKLQSWACGMHLQ